jgi:hypothetical protein
VCIVSEAARLTDIKPTWSHRRFKTPPHGLMQEKVLIATIGLSHKFRDDIATIKSIEAVPSILQAVCHAQCTASLGVYLPLKYLAMSR